MSHWNHYPKNAKGLFKLAFPILISQLSISGMGLADVVMAGLVSDADVSAIAVSNSIYLPLFLFILGILNAITPTVSYLNGASQRELIAHQIRQGGWIVLFAFIPFFLILWNSDWILNFMDTPVDFSQKSQQYLQILSLGMLPALLAVNLRCLNDGLSNPRPAMLITFFGLLLNIPLNYIFIFGKWGMPELGAVGCGVATAIVNWIMFGLLVHYCRTNKTQRDIKLFEKWVETPDFSVIIKLLKLGVPIGFAMFTEVALFSSSAIILAPLGAQVVASHQAALQTSSLFFMLPLALSIASTIMVGQTLGQKKIHEAKYLSYHALITGLILALIGAIIIILFRFAIPRAFTQDQASALIAANLLLFAAIYQLPDAVQAICNGILRGYKHTQVVMYATIICYWIIGLPFSYILARTDWLSPQPLAAQGFWLMFCICLTLSSSILFSQLRRIQRIPEADLIARLERIK